MLAPNQRTVTRHSVGTALGGQLLVCHYNDELALALLVPWVDAIFDLALTALSPAPPPCSQMSFPTIEIPDEEGANDNRQRKSPCHDDRVKRRMGPPVAGSGAGWGEESLLYQPQEDYEPASPVAQPARKLPLFHHEEDVFDRLARENQDTLVLSASSSTSATSSSSAFSEAASRQFPRCVLLSAVSTELRALGHEFLCLTSHLPPTTSPLHSQRARPAPGKREPEQRKQRSVRHNQSPGQEGHCPQAGKARTQG